MMNDNLQITDGISAGKSADLSRTIPFSSFDIRNSAFDISQLHHLAPNGLMALLLANGSMSSNSSGEGDIRRALIEADLVECMGALPGQLSTNTPIPACIWFRTNTDTESRCRVG